MTVKELLKVVDTELQAVAVLTMSSTEPCNEVVWNTHTQGNIPEKWLDKKVIRVWAADDCDYDVPTLEIIV